MIFKRCQDVVPIPGGTFVSTWGQVRVHQEYSTCLQLITRQKLYIVHDSLLSMALSTNSGYNQIGALVHIINNIIGCLPNGVENVIVVVVLKVIEEILWLCRCWNVCYQAVLLFKAEAIQRERQRVQRDEQSKKSTVGSQCLQVVLFRL